MAVPQEVEGTPYIQDLNDAQKLAVETTEGPLLVLAGAGTGKTRVLTTRLSHILFLQKAWASQVLAVTFTNKAAHEMRERISRILGRGVEGLWLGTFHSICTRILRRHAELLGLHPSFTILDTDDQLRLIKQILQASNIDDKKTPARGYLGAISRWKDKGLRPNQVSTPELGHNSLPRVLEIYVQYQERLKTLNAVDFGDLLLHCITLFLENPDILETYQDQFQYILVDEYQDTNVAQYLWLRLLAKKTHNICCVGDDDQSIYGWRGAEVGNILKFEKDFPGAKIVRLEQNYRSTTQILGAASGLISQNKGRLGKTLWTDVKEGEPVLIKCLWDGQEEARWVGEEIEAMHVKKHALSEMAILVRAGFQTREFEERFLTLGVPYRVVGGLRFYERMEIRDALAYLRIVTHRQDSLALERIINTPKRGIGPTTVKSLHEVARDMGISLSEAAHHACRTGLVKGKTGETLSRLLQDIDRWRSLLDSQEHTEVAKIILDESGYTNMWKTDKSPDAPGRLENLKELIAALGEFENLPGFLEHISLVMDSVTSTQDDMVTIMTVHSAKGLEFETVFLAGWEEGIFPHQKAMNESGIAGLEEERRLAYVGLTRAKKRAIITCASRRRMYNQWQTSLPSRFLKEIPEEFSLMENVQTQYSPMSESWGSTTEDYVPKPKFKSVSRKLSAPAADSRVGERVFHQKFGYGKIMRVEGEYVSVNFEAAGIKKVVSQFLEKT
ncbi:MAG: UvrD-helicase domain-containing protein [Alphaproteobacteria bacterium]|nr:UvrD-helicase domain-containing protein [Alphaproteobacteria bacterium]MBT5389423.1 UvrD-helicase domain-containing protein [Alphaproteobacteria bacterium]